jgi:2-dehydro-3-deoxy-D-arabinonate dehydratase
MHLYKTAKGNLLKQNEQWFQLNGDWDELINQDDLYQYLSQATSNLSSISDNEAQNILESDLQPPIGNQEVWAAGVTYLRSRDARMEESEDSGAADCYQRVYDAERPELFFKALAYRVVGHRGKVNIRKDSSWSVPEPELALYINSKGSVQAYTIGNDMSSRSIEGENPLYLPQAKMYAGSASLGPCLFITEQPISLETGIHMQIHRDGIKMFDDGTTLTKMKRQLDELAGWLYREMDFKYGSFLMTGTCVVPPNDFTLNENDVVDISIDGIGTLTNTIAIKK